jgi:hypothetical protein
MPAAWTKQQGKNEREVDESAEDCSALMPERHGREFGGDEPNDDHNRDPHRDDANRIPSDVPEPHRLQRDRQPRVEDGGGKIGPEFGLGTVPFGVVCERRT